MNGLARLDSDVAVIGAGFSGTLLICQLLRSDVVRLGSAPINVAWIERSGVFGPGLAYGTTQPRHLLNVSAGAMSAWPDDPSHLLRWLELNREALSLQLPPETDASSFIPRQIYGHYLQSALQEALATAGSRCNLRQIHAELVDVEALTVNGGGRNPGYRLQLRGHADLTARSVALAWGNSAIPIRDANDPNVRHGWADAPTMGVAPDDAVALIGTGLTMVDMVVSLADQGHRGPIVAISRRGHSPQVHRRVQPYGTWLSRHEAPDTVLGMWRRIRSEVQAAQAQGHDWRSVMDGLRPITQDLWHRLDYRERQRFLRHAGVIWDVHRHRIAPELHELIRELEASGRLRIVAGHVVSQARQGDHTLLTVRRRGQIKREQLLVNRIIVCTGIPLSYGESREPLLIRLQQRGLLKADPLGLGAACSQTGALLNANGAPQAGLYTIGSPRKGDLWESVAVPELRVQASDLAHQILTTWPQRLRALPPTESASALERQQGRGAEGRSALLRQLFGVPPIPRTVIRGSQE
jgi:uncharacterized NAD(P)/FAD-binding protein YdhS